MRVGLKTTENSVRQKDANYYERAILASESGEAITEIHCIHII